MPHPTDDVPAARVHLWQIQAVRDLVFVLLLVWLVYLGYRLSLVTVPLLIGLLLAYLLEPAVSRIAVRTNRTFAAALAVAAFVLLVVLPLAVGLGFAVVQAFEQSQRIEDNWPVVVERVEAWFEKMGIPVEPPAEPPATEVAVTEAGAADVGSANGGVATSEVADGRVANGADDADGGALAQDGAPAAVDPVAAPKKDVDTALKELFPARVLGLPVPLFLRERLAHLGAGELTASAQDVIVAIWGALVGTGTFFFKYVFLSAIFFFFCSVGLERVSRRGPSLVPEANRKRVVGIVRKMNRAIAAFVRGRLVIALILMVLHAVGYWLVGVPAPLLFGVGVGLLCIVPYLSVVGWLGSMIAFAISQAGASDPVPWWWVLAGPTLVYVVLQEGDDYILTPRIQGEQTGLSTPVVLFAVIGGGAIAGVYGVLLSIPIAACIKIFVTDVLWPPYRAWVEGRAEDPLPQERTPANPA